MRKTLQELRYKCRRHNADYYTDSAIPDKEVSVGSHSTHVLYARDLCETRIYAANTASE